jgi:hypothetical protein
MAKIFLTFILRPCNTCFAFSICFFLPSYSYPRWLSSFAVSRIEILSQTLNHMYIFFGSCYWDIVEIHNKSNLLYNSFVVLNSWEVFFFILRTMWESYWGVTFSHNKFVGWANDSLCDYDSQYDDTQPIRGKIAHDQIERSLNGYK